MHKGERDREHHAAQCVLAEFETYRADCCDKATHDRHHRAVAADQVAEPKPRVLKHSLEPTTRTVKHNIVMMHPVSSPWRIRAWYAR